MLKTQQALFLKCYSYAQFIWVIAFLPVIACTNTNTNPPQSIAINNPAQQIPLTAPSSSSEGVNVTYSDRGAYFSYGNNSHIKIDSLGLANTEGYSIHFWVNCTGEEGTVAQNVISLRDTTTQSDMLDLWIGGRKITGRWGNKHFWAKDLTPGNGYTKQYYDLFRIELGKYYFLSVNITKTYVEVFLNGEQYAKYTGFNMMHLPKDILFLGITTAANGERPKDEFQGYIRNVSIFPKTLHVAEIKALSQQDYTTIFQYNDAFELSKFKIEK